MPADPLLGRYGAEEVWAGPLEDSEIGMMLARWPEPHVAQDLYCLWIRSGRRFGICIVTKQLLERAGVPAAAVWAIAYEDAVQASLRCPDPRCEDGLVGEVLCPECVRAGRVSTAPVEIIR